MSTSERRFQELLLVESMNNNRVDLVDIKKELDGYTSLESFTEFINNVMNAIKNFINKVVNNREIFLKFCENFKSDEIDYKADITEPLFKPDDVKKRIYCVEQMLALEHHFRYEAHDLKPLAEDVAAVKELHKKFMEVTPMSGNGSLTSYGWNNYLVTDVLRRALSLYAKLDNIYAGGVKANSTITEVMNLKARIVSQGIASDKSVEEREKVAAQCKQLVITFYQDLMGHVDALCMSLVGMISKFPKTTADTAE